MVPLKIASLRVAAAPTPGVVALQFPTERALGYSEVGNERIVAA